MDLALGVDVAEARKGLDLVVLDGDRGVVTTMARAGAADVAALVADLGPDVVCIDSPPAWAHSGKSRTAERALRPLGITAYSTPTDPGPHPFYRWMRAGFAVFDAVAESHPRYLGGEVRGTAAEVFPEATAVLLRGRLRGRAEPKAAFRRRVLADHGVDPTSLRTVDAVDAALAALTGLFALAGESCTLGDPAEGVILLPVRTLPASRLVRPSVPNPCPVPGRSP
jgi:predicted nuclease with RNAse H fold